MIHRKRCDTIWLREIAEGRKKFEGRLYKGDWINIKIGDTLILYDDTIQVETRVISCSLYRSFGSMYMTLRHQLLPGLFPPEEEIAEKLYRSFYGSYPIFHCLAVELKIIS